MTDSPKLLCCPCGERLDLFVYDRGDYGPEWEVACGCGWTGPTKLTKQEAIEAWNTRTRLPEEYKR